ncbi:MULTISPECIES: DUF2651 family protein [Bacillus]|uniref:DUF2651 domain-containing protein n=1 Tax=Bacillus pumilus (strain SAFR-032) TaxID=315750 RepID=A8FA02_BACP2|nr:MULTISPECIES: DUF2651 family protein [Bacillus]ABV61069.1 hypothetical protein BPUM_0374 [Bacillus pumilus SAFR-032]AVI39895.1 DUF2651 domain-containing protein [Bacillus pumilus]MBC3644332.1 DUF2651 family protein [Bacillus pumilus]MBC3647935.1 DUF2651 family protein [Bacillus pumilus]MBC3651183.1 DUF2651 family protein [Bacillus pumilus]
MAVFILFVVFGFPILSVLIGIFGTMLLKNVWMPTLIVLLASVILMYTSIGGNESFLIWVIIYTVFTLIAAWMTKRFRFK